MALELHPEEGEVFDSPPPPPPRKSRVNHIERSTRRAHMDSTKGFPYIHRLTYQEFEEHNANFKKTRFCTIRDSTVDKSNEIIRRHIWDHYVVYVSIS